MRTLTDAKGLLDGGQTVMPMPGSAPAAAVPAAPSLTDWPGRAIMADPETAAVLYAVWSGDPAVLVPSPPGSGKTRLVALLATALAHRAELRVAVAAQTRSQAVEIARRIGDLEPRLARLMIGSNQLAPATGRTPVVKSGQVGFPAEGGGILIATTAKWLFCDPAQLGADVVIVDEGWQGDYASIAALGAFAAQIVLIGDPGQIDPVVTGRTTRWRDRADGPHRAAPAAILAAYGQDAAVLRLPFTWRLGPDTTALIQPAFYPDLPFASKRPAEHIAVHGQVVPELAHRAVTVTAGCTDPALLTECAERVEELLDGSYTTASGTRPLMPSDLAVVCSHVAQQSAVRALLAAHPEVLVGTANQLQGLERPAVVALHPLAGHRDLDPFNTDLKRLCVLLSRHRAHVTVVTDTLTPDVLTAADPDPTTSGHRDLHDRLQATPTV